MSDRREMNVEHSFKFQNDTFCSILNSLDIGPSISIGICLPAMCSIDHLESLVNKIFKKNSSNMTLNIPRRSCQFEENATDLKTLDVAAM